MYSANGLGHVKRVTIGNPTLVTTALEETWDFNSKVYFLGDWCLRPSRQQHWSKIDYSIAPYHWDDRHQLERDVAHIKDVSESVLFELTLMLNQLHGTDHSAQYWRILIGHWVHFFGRWLVSTLQIESITFL